MDSKNIQLKILAQVVYELRLLLSNHLGSKDESSLAEAIAAHIAYALHNDALAILEDRSHEFDVEKAIQRIKRVDELYGQNISDQFEKRVNPTKS